MDWPKTAHHTLWMGRKRSKSLCRLSMVEDSQKGRSRDRVVAAPSEGMAAGDPLHAHPGSTEPPISRNRFVSVLRAGRVVAAAACEERRDQHLVGANRALED